MNPRIAFLTSSGADAASPGMIHRESLLWSPTSVSPKYVVLPR